MTRPLDGITVVTLEHAIAAPFCTRQLADLGARVIKVERPGTGDFARAYDERVNGMASHFVWTNRANESLSLDVKHPEARKVLEKLLEDADVLVQNLAHDEALIQADTQRALGFGFTAKLCIHPKQVPIVHAALAPSEAALEWARRVMAADAAAARAAVQPDRRMVDVPIVQQARRTLARASA